MAVSRGSIHVTDNSVTAINEAIRQLLDMLDELTGLHDTTTITIGPHTHASSGSSSGGSAGGEIDHDDLANVTIDQHHDRDHAAEHGPGGDDQLKLDDCAAPDDNTDLNASASAHGLLPKLSNNATTFLDGTGVFSTPVVAGSENTDVANVEGDATTPIWEQVLGDALLVTELASGSAMKISAGGFTLLTSHTFSGQASKDFTDLGGPWSEILLITRGITVSGAGGNQFAQFSSDNGATFFTSSGNYVDISQTGIETNTVAIAFHSTSATAARSGIIRLQNFGIASTVRCYYRPTVIDSTSVSPGGLFVGTTAALNAIRITTLTAETMGAGTVYVYVR